MVTWQHDQCSSQAGTCSYTRGINTIGVFYGLFWPFAVRIACILLFWPQKVTLDTLVINFFGEAEPS